MVKAVMFFKRRKDLTRDQFREYWLTNHSKLEKENVENKWVRKIVVSFAIEDDSLGEPPWDGMVELYFDSIEDMKNDIQGAQRKIMYADEENFVDHSFPEMLAVTQEFLVAIKTPRECQI